ncbi:uncharacterized protein LOC118184853 [Stegodyphus dumicola]|uniref:uncharacterized protein LOC118184853 n=1 Tax=Stegodyphus dumicola TaxID=202533 RepID=UPI0015AF682B|nr:uncharacterized protein LOC118184853 [Stegodyphus dumicola]
MSLCKEIFIFAVSVLSLYLPPNNHIDHLDLNDLVAHLPEPFIIMGNFKGHSPLWESKDTSSRGRQIEQITEHHCLCLLNNEQDTYFHEPTKTFHALELPICSPSLLPFCNFSVGSDLCSSDNYPILVSLARREVNTMSRLP